MRLTIRNVFTPQIVLIVSAAVLLLLLVKPGKVQAQKSAPPLALVGPAAPLPVYVVNEPPPVLPEGFVPGSSWKFTTWTIPSTLTFTATVQKTEGGWAYLTVNTDTPASTKWYYVPQMPGAWEPQ